MLIKIAGKGVFKTAAGHFLGRVCRDCRDMDLKPLFVFPRWSNTVTLSVLLFLAVFPLYAGALIAYGLDPVTLNVGYQPIQPVPYSHKLHVGELGLDCRYCHNTVE